MDNCSCLCNIISTIIKIQKKSNILDCTLNTCDRPYLGSESIKGSYNTRPVTLYNCRNNTLWSMPYTLNEEEGTTTIFRVEQASNCCCSLRCLAPNPDTTSTLPYVATDSFFTINLNCLSAIKCLADTYVACI